MFSCTGHIILKVSPKAFSYLLPVVVHFRPDDDMTIFHLLSICACMVAQSVRVFQDDGPALLTQRRHCILLHCHSNVIHQMLQECQTIKTPDKSCTLSTEKRLNPQGDKLSRKLRMSTCKISVGISETSIFAISIASGSSPSLPRFFFQACSVLLPVLPSFLFTVNAIRMPEFA